MDQKEAISEEDSEITKPIFKNGRYENPWESWRKPSLWNFVKFKVKDIDRSNIPGPEELDRTLPVLSPEWDVFTSYNNQDVKVVWIGHATVLIQLQGYIILTDPIFSERCSPMQKVGPKRYRPPPCTIQQLPTIDFVVISHNHYDHLDFTSVKQLNERFGRNLKWFVPMGLKQWMLNNGCENVSELTWWQEEKFLRNAKVKNPQQPVRSSEVKELQSSTEVRSPMETEFKNKSNEVNKSDGLGSAVKIAEDDELMVAFTPTQHWSKRTVRDENKSLWGSWVIKGTRHSFYFAGDTGYCGCFKQIGQKYGPFTLAAIPIGSYEPRWFMYPQHVSPEEAVQIHRDTLSKHSIGIHWGTFKQFGCYEFYLEPKQKISEELERLALPSDAFVTLSHGEVKIVN